METIIYCLYKEGFSEIRYIGKTDNVPKRLKEHVRESLSGKHTAKCKWIKKVIESGGQIKIRIIKKVDVANWQNTEKQIIIACKKRGHRLLNLTDGGEGAGSGKNNIFYGVRLTGKLNGMYNKHHSNRSRILMSINHQDISGDKNPMWNRTHTKRVKAILRRKNLNRIMPLKIRKKIAKAMTGKRNHFYGKHHTKQSKIKIVKNKLKKVEKININTNKVIKVFPSLKSAQSSIAKGNVGDCCRGLQNTAGGFIWRYKKSILNK